MAFRPKILVVEDNPALKQILASSLQHMGADTHCVDAFSEAKSLVEVEKFDGAFVDWDMDQFEPEDLTHRIRRSKFNSKIPVAMLSAGTHENDVTRGFKAGATFFLAKPFGPNEVELLLNASRGAMLEDRRRYQRVPLNVPTMCEWGQMKGLKRVTGRSLNVSSSGLLLKISPQPERGTAVSVELLLPGQRNSLILKGVVARTGPGDQVAVRFVYIGKELQERLEIFVSGHTSSSLFCE
jgi:CheY-like chemotaxis protein